MHATNNLVVRHNAELALGAAGLVLDDVARVQASANVGASIALSNGPIGRPVLNVW